MKRLAVFFVLALIPAPGGGQATSRPLSISTREVEAAVAGIAAPDFARRVGVLAHDSMRGRDTPSPELDAAARWIAEEFRRFGLVPGGDDGSFIQGYPVLMQALDFPASSVRSSAGASLSYGVDVLPVLIGRPGRARVNARAVVLVGSTELERVSRLDLAARAVVVLASPELSGGALVRLIQSIRGRQPAGVLLATSLSDAEWRQASASLEAERFPGGMGGFGAVPVLQVRKAAVSRMLGPSVSVAELEGSAGGALRRVETDVMVSVAQEVREVARNAPNVVGILPGSDPVLRDEYVIFSAHMDHVGVGVPDARGDSIYNGADDNASGTTAVMEIAEAMAALPMRPSRSILFTLVSGEEKGLWGSAHFVEHPPVPLERMVADINVDMVGRNWPDTIVVIGREHSDLGATLARVNASHPELRMTAIDDPWPQERFFFRSDHYNFARKGVPALFFFNGVHADYHEPSDSAEKIDAEKAARVARLVFYLGLDLANTRERPRWNPESYRTIVQGGRGRW
jgi:hypothetical protein